MSAWRRNTIRNLPFVITGNQSDSLIIITPEQEPILSLFNTERDEPFFEIPELQTILREHWFALPERFPGVTLDEFVIMPTHVHFIIHMEGNVEKPVTLGNIIGAYKSLTTRAWLDHIKSTGPARSCIIWQRDYDDRAIIDVKSLEVRRQYIRNNPEKWEAAHQKPDPLSSDAREI